MSVVRKTEASGAVTRWTVWGSRVAAGWSLAYLVLAVVWLVGVAGYPFTVAGAERSGFTPLDGVARSVGALVVMALAGIGVLVSFAMASVATPRALTRRLVTASAATLGVCLAVVVPDYRVLVTVAYTPMALVGGLIGVVDPTVIAFAYRWPVVNLMLFTVAGIAFGAAAVGYWRRTGDGCGSCGRAAAGTAWTSPSGAARWGRWATGVAVAVPVGYAVTRLAWVLGIPLGISAEFLNTISSIVYVGAALGGMAIGGAVLTLGLVQRWGEAVPRWVPWLGGRRVPVAAAVAPAYAVSVVVTSAGLMFLRLAVSGGFDDVVPGAGGQWAAWLPEMFWPLWGVALAAAATAYWLRRREPCGTCGGGTATPPQSRQSHVDAVWGGRA